MEVEVDVAVLGYRTLVPRDCSKLETGNAFYAAILTGRDGAHATCAWLRNPVVPLRINVKA